MPGTGAVRSRILPFLQSPREYLGGEERKLVAEPQSWEDGMLWVSVVLYLLRIPPNSTKRAYTPRTPRTHRPHVPAHAHNRAEERGCGSSSQLRMQHAKGAVCGSTPVSSLGTVALDENDIENYLVFSYG